MWRTHWIFPAVIFLASLALPACSLLPGGNKAPATVPPTAPIVAVATSVPAATSAGIPTATEPQGTAPATETVVPATETAIPDTATAVPTIPTAIPANPTTTLPASTPSGGGTCSYKATFLGDVTIPDNTEVPAGSAFVKTWRVRNDGSCTWGTAGFGLHSLVFVGGAQMSAPSPVPLPAAQVPPGGTVDISVPMVAPTTRGLYRSNWMLQVDNGPQVGVGPNGSAPLFAQIIAGPPSTGAGVTRIVFAPGATESSVLGSLPGGASQQFAVSALAGQTMMLDLSSSSGNASVTVWGAQGINPQVVRSSGTGWLGILPANEDYIIAVSAGASATNFGLSVIIPVRITFAPGAISKTVTGTTNQRRTVTYLLRASAGQTMTATLNAPAGTLGLTIYGLDDGQPLIRAVSGATSWTGELPGTQDYVIEAVPAVDSIVNFSLQVTVQ